MPRSRHEILEEYLEVMNQRDVDRMDRFLTADYIEEYPQSGERVVGIGDIRAIVENYPGGLEPGRIDVAHAQVLGEDEQYLMGPSYSVLHLTGSGDTWTAVVRARYPDGSRWHVVMFVEFRGDRIARMTEYFADPFEAPAWRADFVERM